jgi:hypothetical protein
LGVIDGCGPHPDISPADVNFIESARPTRHRTTRRARPPAYGEALHFTIHPQEHP